jgi:putative hydroxymethylpyrimidine transporter CytX
VTASASTSIAPGPLAGAGDDPGIEPVPQADRTLTAVDLAILWGDLGIGLLVLVTGALLVPGLGFWTAVVAVVLGSVIGCALLGWAASLGAREGVPTMALFRPALGVRGSWLPSALNVIQLIGWTAVEFWAMSFVADLVSTRFFGFSARGLWLAVVAIVCTALALWGPVGVARVWMKRFGAWIVIGVTALVTIVVIVRGDISAALGAPAAGGFPTFGQALDLVIAMPISWLPLVADYTRFATRPRSAFAGTFWGYLVANVWLYILGAMLVLNAGATPDPGGIATGILAIAGGSIAGVLFLVGILAGETDEAFADIYSGAVSLQNIFPTVDRRVFVGAIAAVGAALGALFTMTAYESFLFLIGSVFVPLFGILAAHRFRRRRSPGSSPSEGARGWAIVPFLAGFAIYHWVNPSPVGWLVDAVGNLGGALSVRVPWLGGSLPAFVVSFLVALVVPRLSSAPEADVPERGVRR